MVLRKISSFLKRAKVYFFYLTFLCFHMILAVMAAILESQVDNLRTSQEMWSKNLQKSGEKLGPR